MNKDLPKAIQDVGFDFDWDNKKVWSLNIPVEDMRMEDLEWHFELPFWDKDDKWYVLTPSEVLKNREQYKKEYERIMNSDLSHPLDIMYWKDRWLLLDGLHRLVKAKVMGNKTVKVRKVSREYIPLIKK